MSATTEGRFGWWNGMPGWARMSLVGGALAAPVVGSVWWAHSGGVKPLALSSPAAKWSSGATLPDTLPERKPDNPPPPPPDKQADKSSEPVPAIPVLMSVWHDDAGIKEAEAAAVDRRQKLQEQRQAALVGGGGGASSSDPDTLVPGLAGAGSEYRQRMTATRFNDITPVPPGLHARYTIRKGQRIWCNPDQPLSAAMVGPVQCTTVQAVRSMDKDAVNVLLPVGTVLNGTIEHGIVNGEDRILPIWTDAKAPNHDQPIPLDAASADELGQPGVPGDINRHLLAKGATLALVTAMNMAGNIASSALQGGNGNTTLNLGQAINPMTGLAERAFGSVLNKPDSFQRGQAYPLMVVTTKNIDLVNYFQDVPVR